MPWSQLCARCNNGHRISISFSDHKINSHAVALRFEVALLPNNCCSELLLGVNIALQCACMDGAVYIEIPYWCINEGCTLEKKPCSTESLLWHSCLLRVSVGHYVSFHQWYLFYLACIPNPCTPLGWACIVECEVGGFYNNYLAQLLFTQIGITTEDVVLG